VTEIIIIPSNKNLLKILCSSITRAIADASITCWKNSLDPIFRLERAKLNEVFTDHKCSDSLYSFTELHLSEFSCAERESIILMKPAGLFLRNPDHLWPEQTMGEFPSLQYDLLWMEDRKERLRGSSYSVLLTEEELSSYGHRFVASPGLVACKGSCLDRLFEVWREVLEQGADLDESIREKAVWNKVLVLLAAEMKQKPFERGEVIPLREGEVDWDEVRNACIVSVSDWKDEKAKEHFLRCLYFGHFFGDESGLMLNILDP
jgi:hypothetical protein